MENKYVGGCINKLAAKCGMSSSKLFSTSLLLVFLISASYVLVFGDTNLSATVSPNATVWLKGNTEYQINFTVGGGPDNLTQINITNANFTITAASINLSAWGWACSIINANTFVNCTNVTADANATSALLTLTANTTGIVGEYTAHTWNITTLDNSSVFNTTVVTSQVDAVAPTITSILVPQNILAQNATVIGTNATLDIRISVLDGAGSQFTGAECTVSVGSSPVANVPVTSNWCNTSVDTSGLGLGNYTVRVVVNDTVNNTLVNDSFAIWRSGPIVPGVTQWSATPGPALNESEGDRFFGDGDTIAAVANYTNPLSGAPYTNLTVTADFSQAGVGTPVTADYIGNGLYRASATINLTNMSSQQDMNPINITFSANNGTGSVQFGTWALVVKMEYPTCPPASQVPPGGWPMAPGYNISSDLSVPPQQAYGCTINQTLCAVDTYGPGTWNGTTWLVCAPNFGGSTTNFTQVAKTGNFSNITDFTFDFPGKVKLRFLQPVSFDDQQKAQAVMEFGMKNLMRGGRIGVNESEWNGQGGKPNLNLSAEITVYNITALFGIGASDFNIRTGSFNGSSSPSDLANCPPSKCSGIQFDGENITFQVSSFSTYVIEGATYDLQFSNLTAISSPVNQSVNATYRLNITDAGNHTQQATYNLSLEGIGSLNYTQITLNSTQSGYAGSSIVVELNVSNSSAGTYLASVIARYSTNGSMVWNSTTDGIGAPFATTVLDITNPSVSGGAAVAAANPGNNITLNITATDVDSTISTVLVNLSQIGGSPTAPMTNIGGNNYQLNATVALYTLNGTYALAVRANDTAGNVNNTATISATVNNVAPVVAVIYPNGGESISGTVTINATVSDNNGNSTITNVTFYYSTDGSTYNFINWSNVSQNGVYNVTWTSPSLDSANVTVVANATDGVYVGTDPSNAVFAVDTIAPAVLGGLSTPTSADPGATVKLNVTVTDGVNISQVFVNLSNVGLGALTAMARVSGTGTNDVYEYNLTVPVGYVGAKTFGFRANDTSGNANTTETIALTVNNVAPSVTVIYPNASGYLKGTITVNASATDNNGNSTITNVTFYYTTDGTTYNFINWSNVSQGNAVYNVSWDTSAINAASVTVVANATDGVNTGTGSSGAAFTLDNAAPIFTAMSVTGGNIYAGDFGFSLNITEAYFSSASYRISNASNLSTIWNSSAIASNGTFTSATFDGIYLPVGTWTINVTATDLAGNVNYSVANITSYAAVQPTLSGSSSKTGTIGGSNVTFPFEVIAKGYPYVKAFLNLTSGSLTYDYTKATLTNSTGSQFSIAQASGAGNYTGAQTVTLKSITTVPSYAGVTTGIYNDTLSLNIAPYSGLSAGTYTGTYGFGMFDAA